MAHKPSTGLFGVFWPVSYFPSHLSSLTFSPCAEAHAFLYRACAGLGLGGIEEMRGLARMNLQGG